MHLQSTYEAVLEGPRRSRWQGEDLVGSDDRPAFVRPFLPESLARVASLDFLTRDERLVLNQIRGHGYLHLLGVIEELVVPFVLDPSRPRPRADHRQAPDRLRFALREEKPVRLFRRFRDEILRGLDVSCEVAGPPETLARAVLAHHPLAVALMVLQIGWTTQQHFVDVERDDAALDARFTSLLRHQWMAEAQHAKLDRSIVGTIAGACQPRELDEVLPAFAKLARLLVEHLDRQVELDLATLQCAIGRRLRSFECDVLLCAQRRATRWTFLGSGMRHPWFVAAACALHPEARAQIEEIAAACC